MKPGIVSKIVLLLCLTSAAFGQQRFKLGQINGGPTNGCMQVASTIISVTGTQCGTVTTSGSPTANQLPIFASTTALSGVTLTNGQVLIGSTGTTPVASTLTAGANITITPGAGSITIASSGGGSGTVTSISVGAPLVSSPNPIITSATLSCPSCATSTSPAAGPAHFTGSGSALVTQLINLTLAAEVSGNLPIANLCPTSGGQSSTTFLRGDCTWSVPAGGGNVSSVGTPANGQIAQWTGPSTIQGIATTGTGNAVLAGSSSLTGTTTVVNETVTGTFLSSTAGALSTSPFNWTGAPVTGGTGTTNFPLAYFNTGGAGAVTGFNTSGTYLGFNASSAFAGDFIDIFVNGGANHIFQVLSTGQVISASKVTAGQTASLNINGRSQIFSPADSALLLQNAAASTFNILQFGGTTSSFPALQLSGTGLQAELADQSAETTFGASIFKALNGFQIGGTAPSGHCLVGNGTNYVDNTCPTGSGVVTASPQFAATYYSGAGTSQTVNGVTPPTSNGHYVYEYNVVGAAAVVPDILAAVGSGANPVYATVSSAAQGQVLAYNSSGILVNVYGGINVDPQTGNYTFTCPLDRMGELEFSITAASTLSLPQAGSTTCTGSSMGMVVTNAENSTAILTISATTSTFLPSASPATTTTLIPGGSVFLYSDNTNYHRVSIPTSTGGVNIQTATYALSMLDKDKLIIMNCSSACAANLPATPPSAKFNVKVMSIGSTLATVSFGGTNFNGSASVPVLNRYVSVPVVTDGTSYYGDAPLVAGSGMTFTPASNGLSLAAGGGGSSAFSAITGSTNTTAAMVLGSGASLTVTGSGTNNATSVNSNTFPAASSYVANSVLYASSSSAVTNTANFAYTLVAGSPNIDTITLGGGGNKGQVCLLGTSTGTICLLASNATASNFTMTFPNTSMTVAGSSVSNNFTKQNTFSFNGTSGNPTVVISGTPFVSGTAANNRPQTYLDVGASEPAAFSLAGTMLGINTASGFTGHLFDAWINGTGTGVYSLDYLGNQTNAGFTNSGSFGTATNCAAVGTAASPSLVACSAAPAGAFSCATNASAATCTVATTAVTANSEIFVTENSSEGTRLSVTCNNSPSIIPPVLIASKTAGTGFTINVATISINPACYDYFIIN